MFVVTCCLSGHDKFWLKGTVWAFSFDRATKYATEEDAKAAIAKSAKFNPKAARVAVIEQA